MDLDFNTLKTNNLRTDTQFGQSVLAFITEWFSSSDTVKIQTSGSTGTPKIFEAEKEKMIYSAKLTCDFLGLKEGDSALLCLPIEYISGKMMVVRSIERKLKLQISEPSTKPLKNLDVPIDFCAKTPLQVENSLDKIHLIKNLIIGGAAVSENLRMKISETLKNLYLEDRNTNHQPPAKNRQLNTIYETYGMSETLSHIALKQFFPEVENHFHVFEGIKISLDERGCLQIFAPKLNSETLQTNDLVELRNEQEFRFLGRFDNVVNSGGAKIFPEELEALVKKEIPNEVVFLGFPDDVLGEKLVLVVEGEESEDLKFRIRNLPYDKSFQKPREIIFTAEIPRTDNGKVSRQKLRERINGRRIAPQ